MLTKKVKSYPNYNWMRSEEEALAVVIEMMKDFNLIKDNDCVFYGRLVNLHHDLKQIEINNNENRSTLTEG